MADELTDFIDALRDPYWLVREHTRIAQMHAAEDTQLAREVRGSTDRTLAHVDGVHRLMRKDAELALCKRVGEQLDSVKP